jgi:hypothetical protein
MLDGKRKKKTHLFYSYLRKKQNRQNYFSENDITEARLTMKNSMNDLVFTWFYD